MSPQQTTVDLTSCQAHFIYFSAILVSFSLFLISFLFSLFIYSQKHDSAPPPPNLVSILAKPLNNSRGKSNFSKFPPRWLFLAIPLKEKRLQENQNQYCSVMDLKLAQHIVDGQKIFQVKFVKKYLFMNDDLRNTFTSGNFSCYEVLCLR
jgi:hypothetical protein